METVLSLFDGIAGAHVALDRLGITPRVYIASEIDRQCNRLVSRRYPKVQQVGDVSGLSFDGHVDLLIGGSPCQDLSIAGPNRKGLKGDRSGLFYEYVRILEEVNPTYFLFENVARMQVESRRAITKALGVKPILIDSALVSAQRRLRYYWTNIPDVTQPPDKGIMLSDILEDWFDPKYIHSKKAVEYMSRLDVSGRNKWDYGYHSDSAKNKASTVTANFIKGVPNNVLIDRTHKVFRRFLPVECERLQTLDDNYTAGFSDSARYRMIGNGFCIDVIAHILSFIPR